MNKWHRETLYIRIRVNLPHTKPSLASTLQAHPSPTSLTATQPLDSSHWHSPRAGTLGCMSISLHPPHGSPSSQGTSFRTRHILGPPSGSRPSLPAWSSSSSSGPSPLPVHISIKALSQVVYLLASCSSCPRETAGSVKTGLILTGLYMPTTW